MANRRPGVKKPIPTPAMVKRQKLKAFKLACEDLAAAFHEQANEFGYHVSDLARDLIEVAAEAVVTTTDDD